MLAGRERDLSAKSSSDAEVGAGLFRAVFQGEIGDLFLQSLSRVGAEGLGLRIRLRINPRDRSLASLQRLPWELLYRSETEDFLALSRRTPIVRALDVPRASAPLRNEPPLRILIVSAQQPGHGALDLAGELASLSAALLSNPGIEIQVLEQVDSGALRRTLVQKQFHVLHYMGHSVFERTTGEGALLVSDANGLPEAVTGRHLATKIKDFPSLRLVVLNACSTALACAEGRSSPFGGVATALVLGGVPAVVAMQSPIADHQAVAFSAAFYHRLACGMTLEEAVTEGRQAIHSLRPESTDWAIPILFQRNSPGLLLPFVEEPAKPPARVIPRTRLRLAAGAAAVLLLAAAEEPPRLVGMKALSPVSQATVPSAQAPMGPEPDRAEAQREVRRERAANPPPPASVKRASQVPTSAATGGLRVEISGKPPAGLANAVRRAARTVTASGWTLRLDVDAPRTTPYNESGLSWISCSLSAAGSAEGHGALSDLGTISVVRAKADGGAACDAAGEELAAEAARRLQHFFKEESK